MVPRDTPRVRAARSPQANVKIRILRKPGGLAPLPASVQTVALGGEALPHTLARRVYQEKTVRRLYNLYGPTETTVYSTAAPIPPGAPEPPTIGRPIANTQVYVLDATCRLAPVGVPGELYIGGHGLARGYLRREEPTAERFVADPFGDEPGGRLYRTGDLVRWLPDGELEYLGRLDHQLKVRGFRIEPGEIEAALRQHPAVRQAVVTAREDEAGDRRLVAYVEADGHGRPSACDLLSHLRGRLPQYMVPSAFVVLDALPLTPNGKIDRKALPALEPAPQEPEEAAGYRSPAEEIVAGAWAEILGVPRVAANANFFEMGGHSLLATRVVSRLRELFSIPLQVRDLFEAPTPAGLAARIEVALAAEDSGPDEPIRAVAHEGRPPLSFAQQRLWFLDQWQSGGAVYNIPASVRLTGPLNVAALEQALQEIVRRHDVLRATFPAEQGQPTQGIAPNLPLRLSCIDLESFPAVDREAEAGRLACEEARRPFDLARGPLLRATLLRLGPQEHVALVVMHHIVSDGWSLGVFLKELATLYGSYAAGMPSPLAEPPVQYADYAAWQRRRLNGPALERLLAYWRDRLAGAPRPSTCPPTGPTPPSRPTAAPPCALGCLPDRPGTSASWPGSTAARRSWCCWPPSRCCCTATAARTTFASARPSPAAAARKWRAWSACSSTRSCSAPTCRAPLPSRRRLARMRGLPGGLCPRRAALRAPRRGAAAPARPRPYTALPDPVRPGPRCR